MAVSHAANNPEALPVDLGSPPGAAGPGVAAQFRRVAGWPQVDDLAGVESEAYAVGVIDGSYRAGESTDASSTRQHGNRREKPGKETQLRP